MRLQAVSKNTIPVHLSRSLKLVVVRRILLEGDVAIGVELNDGEKITATREVVLSCGAIRTPQVFMLSGIGPAEELSQHGIEQLIDAPEVGHNFHDHLSMMQFYKGRFRLAPFLGI